MAYASESLALAAMETFVHLQPVDQRIRFAGFSIVVPDGVTVDVPDELPDDWRAQPPGESTQSAGSKWAAEGRSTVWKVPSILAPGEYNLLLNPLTHTWRS